MFSKVSTILEQTEIPKLPLKTKLSVKSMKKMIYPTLSTKNKLSNLNPAVMMMRDVQEIIVEEEEITIVLEITTTMIVTTEEERTIEIKAALDMITIKEMLPEHTEEEETELCFINIIIVSILQFL